MNDNCQIDPNLITSGKLPLTVPFVVYESATEKADRQQRRLVGIIVVLIALLFLTNALWIVAWNNYDYVDDYSVDVDAGDGGNANYIGNDGDIYNGTSNGTKKTEQDT